MMQNTSILLTRRSALLGLTAAFTLGRTSLALAAAPTENRFVVVILRGAMDGLSAVQPYGDPSCVDVRGVLALPQPGSTDGLLDLGGFYGLHPELTSVHDMYKANEALIIHAAAGHYRSRSHFEAQDFLECGVDQRLNSGWLNRAVSAMPAVPGRDLALSTGLSAPLMLRGPARVAAWAPEHFGQAPAEDLYARLLRLSSRDPVLGPALTEGLKQRGISPDSGMQADGKKYEQSVLLASTAGKMLAAPSGPRVAVLELNGWDTHSAQVGRLKNQFKQLDATLAALRAGLGDSWRRTAVLLVTEFGRTAHINGTNGTDHGTGGVAFLLGGAVAGGKVRADWPGLGSGRLFENRDLMPTTDVRAIAKGVLAEHLGLGANGLDAAFPGSTDAPALRDLVRT
jgi:uncharacterized protein (DUF1501 family)